jgi:hypothetical protein
MPNQKLATKFEPIELKAHPLWTVRVTLPHGESVDVGHFEAEARARDWIANKAANWLKKYRGGRYA